MSNDNELPKSTYYAKKLMCPFRLEYKKIHACPNDYMLYRMNMTISRSVHGAGCHVTSVKGAEIRKGPQLRCCGIFQ